MNEQKQQHDEEQPQGDLGATVSFDTDDLSYNKYTVPDICTTPQQQPPPPHPMSSDSRSRLSTVSKHYDRGNKGYLDETERALRKLDSSNKGYIGMDKLYTIMQTLQQEQNRNTVLMESLQNESTRNAGMRKTLIALLVITMMLVAANIGTSFAVAVLAKDTQVTSSTNDFVSTSSSSRVGVTSKHPLARMQPVDLSDALTRRHLRQLEEDFCEDKTASGGQFECTIQGQVTYEDAKHLYRQFSPYWNEVGDLMGDPSGVDEVILVCGTHRSTVKATLPDWPPLESDDGMVVFPTPGTGYVGSAPMEIEGQLLPCTQEISISMYCPQDTVSGEEAPCWVFSTWDPTLPNACEVLHPIASDDTTSTREVHLCPPGMM